MDRNWELAESLKKHGSEHRNLASILLNGKVQFETTVSLFLLSFQSYLY